MLLYFMEPAKSLQHSEGRRRPDKFYTQIRWNSKPGLLAEVIQAKTPLTTVMKGKIHDHSCMDDLKPKYSK